jgi:hypothetical protein
MSAGRRFTLTLVQEPHSTDLATGNPVRLPGLAEAAHPLAEAAAFRSANCHSVHHVCEVGKHTSDAAGRRRTRCRCGPRPAGNAVGRSPTTRYRGRRRGSAHPKRPATGCAMAAVPAVRREVGKQFQPGVRRFHPLPGDRDVVRGIDPQLADLDRRFRAASAPARLRPSDAWVRGATSRGWKSSVTQSSTQCSSPEMTYFERASAAGIVSRIGFAADLPAEQKPAHYRRRHSERDWSTGCPRSSSMAPPGCAQRGPRNSGSVMKRRCHEEAVSSRAVVSVTGARNSWLSAVICSAVGRVGQLGRFGSRCGDCASPG